jgi:hypothetical protein
MCFGSKSNNNQPAPLPPPAPIPANDPIDDKALLQPGLDPNDKPFSPPKKGENTGLNLKI